MRITMTTTSRAIGQFVIAGEGVHKVSESPSTPSPCLCRLCCGKGAALALPTRAHLHIVGEG